MKSYLNALNVRGATTVLVMASALSSCKNLDLFDKDMGTFEGKPAEQSQEQKQCASTPINLIVKHTLDVLNEKEIDIQNLDEEGLNEVRDLMFSVLVKESKQSPHKKKPSIKDRETEKAEAKTESEVAVEEEMFKEDAEVLMEILKDLDDEYKNIYQGKKDDLVFCDDHKDQEPKDQDTKEDEK